MQEVDEDMTEGKEIPDCPIGMDVCYGSCFFWRSKCAYDQVVAECQQHLEEFRNEERGEGGDAGLRAMGKDPWTLGKDRLI